MKDKLNKILEEEIDKEISNWTDSDGKFYGEVIALKAIRNNTPELTTLIIEEMVQKLKGSITLYPTVYNKQVFTIPVGWSEQLEKDVINLFK